jgi:N-methylhydantoinase B
LRTDSAGPGRFRGGLGIEKVYRITAPCRLNLKIDRTKCPPWGLEGGGAGEVSDIEFRSPDGTVRHVLKGDHELQPGDTVIVRTAGGGGFGPPWQRDVARVLQDVQLGYVSIALAREQYGIAIDEDGSFNEADTERLRLQMATMEDDK